MGGIPLIYLGDELVTLNDYSYRDDPNKVRDSRWVHRPAANWETAAERSQPGTTAFQIYAGLKRLIAMRKAHPVFNGHETEIIDTGNAQVFGYLKTQDNERILALANFSEYERVIPTNLLRLSGLGYQFIDLESGDRLPWKDLTLSAYQFMCLKAL
jgi:amylosucrase